MPNPSSRVYFFFDQVNLNLPNRTGLKKFIESLFKKERTRLETLNYIFCSDEKILQINRDFLQHDYYTDIISFELSPTAGSVQGEIYISKDRVRENASELNIPFQQELHRVIFHGALHLCGYRDKTKADQSLMRKKEDHYLKSYLAR